MKSLLNIILILVSSHPSEAANGVVKALVIIDRPRRRCDPDSYCHRLVGAWSYCQPWKDNSPCFGNPESANCVTCGREVEAPVTAKSNLRRY